MILAKAFLIQGFNVLQPGLAVLRLSEHLLHFPHHLQTRSTGSRGQPVCNARYGMGNLTSLRMTVSLMLDPVSWLARLVSICSTASFHWHMLSLRPQ